MPANYTGVPGSASGERVNPTGACPADGDAGSGATFQTSLHTLLDEVAALKQKVAYLDATAAFTAALSTNTSLTVSAGGAVITGGLTSNGPTLLTGTTTIDSSGTQPYNATRTRVILVPAVMAQSQRTDGAGGNGAMIFAGRYTPSTPYSDNITDPAWWEMSIGDTQTNILVFPLNCIGLQMGSTITGLEVLAAHDHTHVSSCRYWLRKCDANTGPGTPTFFNTSGATGDTKSFSNVNDRAWNTLNAMSSMAYASNASTGFWYDLVMQLTLGGSTTQPIRIYGLRVTYTTATAIEQAS